MLEHLYPTRDDVDDGFAMWDYGSIFCGMLIMLLPI